jgi:CheY-like chemotaxis protein
VLLVEDVELNQQLIAGMLRRHGHEVAVASDGKEAVEAVARECFDLVLMDVQMPVMDGVEATRRIRALPPPAREVPVLALTANVMASERQRYLEAGMNDALTKPVDWPQLLAAITRWARRPGAGSTEEAATAVESQGAAAAPATAAPPEPVLDRAAMAQLEAVIGREALGEMLGAPREEVSRRATAIRAPGTSAAAIGEEAHKLVSTAGSLGFKQLSARSRDRMHACRGGASTGAVSPLVEAVHEAAVSALRLIDTEFGPDWAAEVGPATLAERSA